MLNLASRLVDIARPSGIVFHGKFGIELLLDELRSQFAKEIVYLRSVAEKTPTEVYITKALTAISAINKRPLETIDWAAEKLHYKMKKIRDLGPVFHHALSAGPLDAKQISISVTYPLVKRWRRIKGISSGWTFERFSYFLDAGIPQIAIDFDTIAKQLSQRGVKDSWMVVIEIKYPKK